MGAIGISSIYVPYSRHWRYIQDSVLCWLPVLYSFLGGSFWTSQWSQNYWVQILTLLIMFLMHFKEHYLIQPNNRIK
jgi:hypothetical protein